MVSPTHAPAPLVSVVLPVYNRVASIRMAVESVLHQSFADLELLVVDDGSTDGTMAQLAEVTDPRLRCLSNPHNMGASAARNTGIRAARGQWVAFQDSDDAWLPQKLAKQVARLAAAGPETVACYCGMAVVGQPEQAPGARIALRYIPDSTLAQVEGDLRDPLLVHSFISTQMLVVRRSTLIAIGGFDETLPALEDWDCTIRLAQCGTFAFVDEPLVMQYFSLNSITRSRERRMRALTRILEKHAGLLAAQPRTLARHHMSLAGEKRRLGDPVGARASLAAACRLHPADLSIWARLALLSILPSRKA